MRQEPKYYISGEQVIFPSTLIVLRTPYGVAVMLYAVFGYFDPFLA